MIKKMVKVVFGSLVLLMLSAQTCAHDPTPPRGYSQPVGNGGSVNAPDNPEHGARGGSHP